MSLKNNKDITVSVSNQTIVRVILMTIATFAAFRFVIAIAQPLVLIFVAFFLALALNPAITWMNRRLKIKSRVRATAITYTVLITFLITFFSVVMPPLIGQAVDFAKQLPGTIEEFEEQDTVASRFVVRYELQDELREFGGTISSRAKNSSGELFSVAGRLGAAIVSTITVLVLAFMMLAEGPFWLDQIYKAQKKSKRERRKQLAMRMYRVVTGYVNGQLLIALIAAGFAMTALFVASTLLDAPVNAVALSGIVFLLGLVPLIGNTIAAVLVVLACLLVSGPLAVIMAVFFVLYQQIENITIQPYIQSKKNELTPLTVFIAAILGVGFGGILGGFISIPLAGCIKILATDYYESK